MNSEKLFNFTESVDVEANKYNVIDSLGLVQREGIDDLIDYLESTNYYQSPASSRFHQSFSGGLVQHSLNVTREFSKENVRWVKPLPQDSVIICGLCHDLCKIGAYIETATGYETVKDFPKGHGKLSVEQVSKFIELTQPEKDIILFHMGSFGIYTYHEYSIWSMHSAITRTPHVQVFAAIDMMDSKRKEEESRSRRG
jgi:23S rRNA maturation-related 3'-5' exoribonuclease YhaM